MGLKKLTVEEIVSRLRPIDDIFFHKLAETEGFCEELLQVIVKNNIELIEVTPQKTLRNIKAKSVTIDDGSDIAELMKIFKSSDIPDNKKFPRICEAIKAIKEEKGSGDMCKLVEDYAIQEREEERKQSCFQLIINLMKTMNVSITESMDMLLIPGEEREMYMEMI